jgi:hypothetical protein
MRVKLMTDGARHRMALGINHKPETSRDIHKRVKHSITCHGMHGGPTSPLKTACCVFGWNYNGQRLVGLQCLCGPI